MLAHPLGMVAAHQGDQSTASWAADRLEWWATRHDALPCRAKAADVRGTLAAVVGDWAVAHAWFEDGVRVLHDLGYRHPGVIPVLPRAVEAAAAAGYAEALRRHVDDLAASAAALDAPWVDAQVAYGRAALLLLDGAAEEARAALAGAADTVEGCGHRLDATRMRLTAANACATAGEPAAARSLLGRCRDEFTMMAATGWVATIEGLTDRVATRRVASLTPTESCIASLVAAGRRNREIAAELYVSVSTVEAHLTRMYRKVGVRSRTGLAQLVAG
jgi:DNA-binding NarL/FixJ family response regulator